MRAATPASLAFILAHVFLQFAALPAFGQQAATSGAWLEQLDRDHHRMVPRGGHVHATGRVEAVDTGPGIITVWSTEIQSQDRTIWMPPMRMTYHVTNRRMLRGVQPGDVVEFEAARLRNAVMITKLRKAR